MTKRELLDKFEKKVGNITKRRGFSERITMLDVYKVAEGCLALFVMGANERRINNFVNMYFDSLETV